MGGVEVKGEGGSKEWKERRKGGRKKGRQGKEERREGSREGRMKW